MRLSQRRLAVVVSLVLGSFGCCALVLVRNLHTGNVNFRYLIWNLFLAWIPFVLAILFYDGHRRGMGAAGLTLLGCLWLLFFPNAPYIVTDFVHLSRDPDPSAPFWFDAVTIASFATVGMLLGLGSLYLVQGVVRKTLGSTAAWVVAAAALALGSVGIYLGRFVRLNSWDFLTHPQSVLALVRLRLADPLGNPRLLAVTLGTTALLAAAYLVLYVFASSGLRLELDRRH